MGMDIANYISMQFGYLDSAVFESMHKLLSKNMPDFKIDEKNIEAYLKALSRDKKNTGEDLTCILSCDYGAMKKAKLPMDEKFKGFVMDYFKKQVCSLKVRVT